MRFYNLVVALVVAMVLVVVAPVTADQGTLGGVWIDGHSYDGEYGVNNKGGQSYGVRFTHEWDGLDKRISKNNVIGIDTGVMLAWYRITATDNSNGRDNWTIKHVNSLMAGVYPAFYLETHDRVRFAFQPMIGAEFADDNESSPFVGAGLSIQYSLTETVELALVQEEIMTFERRFDSTSLNLVFTF